MRIYAFQTGQDLRVGGLGPVRRSGVSGVRAVLRSYCRTKFFSSQRLILIASGGAFIVTWARLSRVKRSSLFLLSRTDAMQGAYRF